MSKKIEIDTNTIIKFWLIPVIFLGLMFFITKAWTGLIIVGAAIFIAIALRPLSDRISNLIQKHISKNKNKDYETLSNILAFVGIIIVLGLIIGGIGPVMISETSKFFSQAPETISEYLEKIQNIDDIGKSFGVESASSEIMATVSSFASSMVANLGDVITGVGSLLSAVLLTIVLTLFFLIEGPKLYDSFFDKLSNSKMDENVNELRRILSRMAGVISSYCSKQVLIAIIDGLAVTVAVFVLALIFGFSLGLALPMGLISMTFYLIPMFGQVIGCLIISLILLVSNPIAGIIYLIFYVVYAQIEGNFIATYIQGDAMKLSPLIILVAIVIGMYTAGLLGAIIAIPVAGCVKVLIEELPTIRSLRDKD